MSFKSTFKKVLLKISPTYKKVDAMQQQIMDLNSQINKMNESMIKAENRNLNMLWMMQKNNPKNLKDTQKDFWNNYPKATGDMRIVQTGNMFVLKAMRELCDKNGLTFWLHGGTLIGAVRHGGCIPWDDDVDVAMTRADIEKFKKVCDESEEYQLNIYYHDNEKFSRAYQFKRRNQEIPCFVDIFVFDYYNPSQNDLKKADGDFKLINKWFKNKFNHQRTGMVKGFLEMKDRPRANDVPGTKHFGTLEGTQKTRIDDYINRNVKNIADPYNGEYLYYSVENYPFPYPLFPADKIFPTQKCLYEGIECDMPADPTFYLTGYGDFWQMPSDFEEAPHFRYFEPHVAEIKEFTEKNNFSLEK